MDAIELKLAFWWFCENCSEENFVKSQVTELTDEQREEAYRGMHELGEWEELPEQLPEQWDQFQMTTTPEIVTCVNCKTQFHARDEEW